jgi:hypothetical protein
MALSSTWSVSQCGQGGAGSQFGGKSKAKHRFHGQNKEKQCTTELPFPIDPDARRKTLGSDVGALRSDADSFDAADARLAESRILEAEDSVSAGHAARHRRRRNVGAPLLERRLPGRQGHRIGRH